MKKLITKFTSIFLAVVVLMSCVVSVSAESTAEVLNEPLLSSLPEPSAKYLSVFFEDDVLKYDNFIIFRYFYSNKTYYQIFALDNGINNDLSYFSLSSTRTYSCNDDLSYSNFNYVYITYCQDTDTYVSTGSSGSSGSNVLGSNLILNNYTVNGTDLSVETLVKNIIYSDFSFKYCGLTVYDTSDNKSIVIPNLLDKSDLDKSDSDNNNLYGTYLYKNEETLKEFCNWLITTEKYKDLSKYNLNIAAENLYSVVDCWWDNKFSPTLFLELVRNNGVNTIATASSIIAWFSARWSEYISINNAVVEIEYDENANVNMHHRATDVTEDITETDENGNVIVIQEKDNELLLVLREILRQIINLPANISKSTYVYFHSLVSNIADNIYSLCLSAYDLPQLTANAIYNNFVEPINQILNAINNIEIDNSSSSPLDSIFDDFYNKLFSVFVPDESYMTSWNEDVSGLINSKFGFIGQLAELNQIINTYCFGNEQIVSYASVDDGQLELEEYMNYPSFRIPAFNAGIISSNEPITIIDWSIIDEYRIYLHRIIVAVCYTVFISKRFKRTPNMIANNDIAD